MKIVLAYWNIHQVKRHRPLGCRAKADCMAKVDCMADWARDKVGVELDRKDGACNSGRLRCQYRPKIGS